MKEVDHLIQMNFRLETITTYMDVKTTAGILLEFTRKERSEVKLMEVEERHGLRYNLIPIAINTAITLSYQYRRIVALIQVLQPIVTVAIIPTKGTLILKAKEHITTLDLFVLDIVVEDLRLVTVAVDTHTITYPTVTLMISDHTTRTLVVDINPLTCLTILSTTSKQGGAVSTLLLVSTTGAYTVDLGRTLNERLHGGLVVVTTSITLHYVLVFTRLTHVL